MGIVNVTPDSFSDGGRIEDVHAAVALGRRLAAEGAAVLDVGGESTRPGARPVPADEELERVLPVVRALVERVGLPVSIDTRKAEVFVEAWRAGASMLNDVSGLTHDPELAGAVAETEAALVLMHMRGTPETMVSEAVYEDPTRDVARELARRRDAALEAGVPLERIILDPGIGFAKTTEQNLALLKDPDPLRLPEGHALLVGPSRKRFLGEITGVSDPRGRDVSTAMVCGWLAARGVEMVRVHAVGASREAIAAAEALAARSPSWI